ncbi:MAG: hypoxanthine phosphoribosyltransferase [Bacteroidales bacterium]|nr:hypoxanthine phosphoribosyltransferase [Bacteroidales bacterium]
MNEITIRDKRFELLIPHEKIIHAIGKIAGRMNSELADKDVVFLGILNGAFMFASDLLQLINFQCRISFLKLVSYQGTGSTGTIKRLIGLNEDITGKVTVVLEDIIDSGMTISNIMQQLKGFEPAEIKIASLLIKPDNFHSKVKIDYTGYEIPDDFVIGYGLDYNGYGRNLLNIYKTID